MVFCITWIISSKILQSLFYFNYNWWACMLPQNYGNRKNYINLIVVMLFLYFSIIRRLSSKLSVIQKLVIFYCMISTTELTLWTHPSTFYKTTEVFQGGDWVPDEQSRSEWRVWWDVSNKRSNDVCCVPASLVIGSLKRENGTASTKTREISYNYEVIKINCKRYYL